MRAAIQPHTRRSAFTARSAPATVAVKVASLRTSRTPSSGTSISTATSAISVATSPASPKVRIRSELENCRAMKDTPAVACVSTQAGPTTRIALRSASDLLLPSSIQSRAAKVSCMLSEKLMTMMSGVITLRNMLRRKSSQPSVPSASTMAISGGAAAMTMNDTRRKNTMAIRQPAAKPKAL